jgi:hypothetical protein
MNAFARSGTVATERRPPRPALRPLVLPTEHGGWGFLFEPLTLSLIVAPSWGGVLIALAFVSGFLTRQPLKFALQDALRRKSYPRTRWCWTFALAYAGGAALALAAAVAVSGWRILVPLAIVSPLAIVQIAFDAKNRSRALWPELGGAIAMSSSAAAIAIAAGLSPRMALALPAVLVARGIPTIIYVRTLLQRAHGQQASPVLPLALHAIAVAATAAFAPKLVVAMMALLLLRAAWGLSHPVPPAKKIGWSEIAWGALTVAVAATAFVLG